MTDQTPSGGVGPLHEAIAALPVMWHLRRPASSTNDLEAFVPRGAVLRVVGTQLTREIEALYGTGETAMSRPTKSRMLAVVAALLEHPDA